MSRCERRDILFLCQFFYPEYISSAELPFTTAKCLARAGFTVDALCGYPKEYAAGAEVPLHETAEGVSITRVRYLQLPRTSTAGRLVNYFSLTASVLLKLPRLRKYRCVVVYSNPPMLPIVPVLAKKLFGTEFIFVAYDLYPEIAVRTGAAADTGLAARVMRAINRRVYAGASRVVALSGEMKDFIAANRPVPADRLTVIPNWYRDMGADYARVRQESALAEKYAGKFVVSYLGNMGTCQDMDTLLDCAALLKDRSDICFLLAGHGNKVAAIRQRIQAEGLAQVTLLDFLHGQDYLDALAVSSCSAVSLAPGITGLCSPSKVYGYMMAGNPILAIMDESDIVSDMDSRGIGIHVRSGQSRELADAVLRLRADPALVAEMGRRSRGVFLEKYTEDLCVRQYIDLFTALLGRPAL